MLSQGAVKHIGNSRGKIMGKLTPVKKPVWELIRAKAVLLSLERKCVTTRRGISGILASSGISISAGATYSGSVFMLQKYSLMVSG